MCCIKSVLKDPRTSNDPWPKIWQEPLGFWTAVCQSDVFTGGKVNKVELTKIDMKTFDV